MTIFPAGSYRDKVYFQHFFKKNRTLKDTGITLAFGQVSLHLL